MYIFVTAVILSLSIISEPVQTGIGIAMILTGVPVYVVFIAWKDKPGKTSM